MDEARVRETFSQKSSDELRAISGSGEYTDAARTVALELLKERGEASPDASSAPVLPQIAGPPAEPIKWSWSSVAVVVGLTLSSLGFLLRSQRDADRREENRQAWSQLADVQGHERTMREILERVAVDCEGNEARQAAGHCAPLRAQLVAAPVFMGQLGAANPSDPVLERAAADCFANREWVAAGACREVRRLVEKEARISLELPPGTE